VKDKGFAEAIIAVSAYPSVRAVFAEGEGIPVRSSIERLTVFAMCACSIYIETSSYYILDPFFERFFKKSGLRGTRTRDQLFGLHYLSNSKSSNWFILSSYV
jgi:hypothetical protein